MSHEIITGKMNDKIYDAFKFFKEIQSTLDSKMGAIFDELKNSLPENIQNDKEAISEIEDLLFDFLYNSDISEELSFDEFMSKYSRRF